MPLEETTIAEAFREEGYKTFFAGKWHLGSKGSFPEDHGFDVNVGGHLAGTPPGGFYVPYKNPKMTDGPAGECLPVRLGQEAADFIETNKDEPFFAFLSFYSVHAPIQSSEELWKKYRAKAEADEALSKIENRFLIDRTMPVRQVQDHPLYAGMVESMDDGVGKVLEALDRLGLAENTIVVFHLGQRRRLFGRRIRDCELAVARREGQAMGRWDPRTVFCSLAGTSRQRYQQRHTGYRNRFVPDSVGSLRLAAATQTNNRWRKLETDPGRRLNRPAATRLALPSLWKPGRRTLRRLFVQAI